MLPKIQETLELVALLPERSDRIQFLIDLADGFRDVPESVAVRPFSCDHRVPSCESEVFVWGVPRADGRLDFHFAVENPQGISAKAMAALLREAVSGAPLEELAELTPDFVYDLFGRELSMGKSMGLMAMVSLIRTLAKRQLAASVPN